MTAIEIRPRGDDAVVASAAGLELFTYVYRPDTPQLEAPKPYLHPVRTRAGAEVTAFRPADHVWHKGIAWSLPVVGDENFWGGPSYRRDRGYVQLENDGAQVHREMTALGADDAGATIAHTLDWIAQSGELLFTEERALTAHVLDDTAWALVFRTAMTNVSGRAIPFGSPTTEGRENAGYGGLFWRGPEDFTGGTVVTPDGVADDAARGTRADWMAFADAATGALVLMHDAPANPRHPTEWFARSAEYAGLNPAPFFREELRVEAGETVRFAYGVGVADAGTGAAPALAAAVRRLVG